MVEPFEVYKLYLLLIGVLDIIPMKLRLDEKGKMTFKKGKVRTIRKK